MTKKRDVLIVMNEVTRVLYLGFEKNYLVDLLIITVSQEEAEGEAYRSYFNPCGTLDINFFY